MKLTEIAERIDAHLRRMERDPAINIRRDYNKSTWRWEVSESGIATYYGANARRSGSRVRVVYVSYQGASTLKRDEAAAYLAWLDAGNNGTHYEQQSRAAAGSEQ